MNEQDYKPKRKKLLHLILLFSYLKMLIIRSYISFTHFQISIKIFQHEMLDVITLYVHLGTFVIYG